ncbi:MAG TPA: hypothetical protein VIN35_00910 [Hydrogenophaga sp.]
MAQHPRAFARLMICLAAVVTGFATNARADELLCPGLESALSAPPGTGHREVFLSNYTHHWTHSEEHRRVRAMSVQQNLAENRFCGLSLFTNSFGQPSMYLYVGKTWPRPIPAIPKLYASLSGGLLYGYVRPYQNKVPLNFGGFSPGLVPTVGYQITPQVSLQTQWLGLAAVMVGASLRY